MPVPARLPFCENVGLTRNFCKAARNAFQSCGVEGEKGRDGGNGQIKVKTKGDTVTQVVTGDSCPMHSYTFYTVQCSE